MRLRSWRVGLPGAVIAVVLAALLFAVLAASSESTLFAIAVLVLLSVLFAGALGWSLAVSLFP
jgi:ABC-type uncharacterized transport system permease subunit